MTKSELKKKALSLPLQPGVYIMMNSENEVIYVGKAKALKNRVSQYFQDSVSHTPKTVKMVSQIDHFDTIIATTEFEALVLECSLIKQYMPKYNILLKDGKGFPFVRIDMREPYPSFSVVSKPGKDGASYYGPLGSRGATFDALRAVGEVFHLPDCSRKFPRDFGKERPCLNAHLGKCMALCTGKISQEEYHQVLLKVLKLLEGKYDETLDELKKEMEQEAEQLNFEKAAVIRNQIRGLEQLSTRQRALSSSFAERDVIGFYEGAKKSAVAALHFRKGQLTGRDLVVIHETEDSPSEIISAYLKQSYLNQGTIPKEIVLDREIEDAEPMELLLSQQVDHRVHVLMPVRGEKRRLVEMAQKNAREEVERVTTQEERTSKTLEELQRILKLDGIPRRIEAFDISNTGSTEIVAGMTVFYDGKPLKRDYRHFKIKSTDGQDDYHSMQEAVRRRFLRMDEKTKEGFSARPDLLLIDGGDVHANAALEVLTELGIQLPVWGMVKDDRHRTRALQSPQGEEVSIQDPPSLFALIGNIQEETHRFAITYHRKLRGKRGYRSELDRIPGVGPQRKKMLLKTFSSIKKIREASKDELAKVVGPKLADSVYDYFRQEEKKQ